MPDYDTTGHVPGWVHASDGGDEPAEDRDQTGRDERGDELYREHVEGFGELDEQTQLTHLIEHGYWIRELRLMDDEHRATLHGATHSTGTPAGSPPDLADLADRAVKMAAGMREHVHAGDWASAYGAADWLADYAEQIESHVWAAHPDARPENW
jgi:hypothetical protein